MNFNDQRVTWDTNTLPTKDRDTCTLSSLEALIEVYKYSRVTKILDAEYNQRSASLDDVIKKCEKLHVEEQHQFKI
jgi:hypothetical protein